MKNHKTSTRNHKKNLDGFEFRNEHFKHNTKT